MRHALVIGLGHMGTFHRKVLRDFGFKVSSVDPLNPRADFESLEEALFAADYDLAVAAVPQEDLAAVARGLEMPLLVEKPFASTVGEAEALAEEIPHARVGYVERFNPKVLELREWLKGREVATVSFVRHNDRPSPDTSLDLLTHDLDLARFLRIPLERCTFDTEADNDQRLRVITVNGKAFNLMAHDTSPLHGMWHAFLTGSPDVATPEDAIAALKGALVEAAV